MRSFRRALGRDRRRIRLQRVTYYIIELAAYAGLPEAKDGNLEKQVLPISGVVRYTSMFQLR